MTDEIKEKVQRVRDFIEQRNLDGILLTST